MNGLFPSRMVMAAALACTATVVLAQETTSSIRGSVSDEGGAALSGATVSIVHTPSGTTSTVVTGASGAFSAAGLRPGGPYKVTVSASGMEDKSVEGFYLSVGEPLNLPVSLESGALEELEEVAITGSRALALATGPTTTFSREDIEGIASVQRDIRDVARQDPFAAFNPSTRGVSIAGQNNRTNRFSVDGVRFSDNFGLNQGGLPTTRGPVPLDAVEQMSVKVAPYDITEGDFQGGSINVVMRSGSNDFDGSAFYTYTSDKLTGDKSRELPVNLDFTSKNFGAFVSGPILENRLFFAVSYENLKAGDPTDIGLAGSPSPIPGLTAETVDQVSDIALDVYGHDTLGVRLVKPEEDDKYTGKLDWNVMPGQRLSYTVIHQKTYQQSTNSGSLLPPPSLYLTSNSTNEPEKVTSHVMQWNGDWNIGLSTELRANYRESSKIPSSLGAAGFSQFQVCTEATSSGAITTCPNATPRVYFGVEQFSQADVVGQDQYGLELVGRYSIGNHALKAQAAFNALQIENVFVHSSLGLYYFDSIASLQSGNADQFDWQYATNGDLGSLSASFDYDQYTLGLQDSWNILPGLNVTYGLRYDMYQMSDRPPENQPFVTRYGGFTNTHTIDGYSVLQPRISATWRPLSRLQVRAGFGLFNGGSPDVFLGNSFSVAGVYQNSIRIIRDPLAASGCNVADADLCAAALNFPNVTGDGTALPDNEEIFRYLSTNVTALQSAPVNAMVDDFKLPSSWKASLSVDYTADLMVLGDGWNLGADVYAGWAKAAVAYRDIRLADSGNRSPDGRIIYRYLGTAAANQDLLLYNNHKGKSTIVVGRLDKAWDFGLGAGISYTWQDVNSTSDMTGTTALQGGTTASGSYATAPSALDPNVAAYGTSLYEVKGSFKLNLNYSKAFFGDNKTRLSLFWERRSGSPYSLTMRSGGSGRSLFGTLNTTSSSLAQRYLLYVPDVSSQTADPAVQYASTPMYEAFRDYVLANDLPQGEILGKNTMRSPRYSKMDLHLEQELPGFHGRTKFKLFADVENVLNLIDSKYGSFRYYDNVSPVVDVGCVGGSGGNGGTCPTYIYSNFVAPVERTDGRVGLWSVRLGARFEF